MNTQLTEDQAALEEFCRKLLEKEWPLERALRALGPDGPGHSAQLWQSLVDAGWLGLPFPAELGGAGGTLVDLGLAWRAAGERLVPNTLYSCGFAALLIERLGSAAQQRELLGPLLSGERLATVAYGEPHASEELRLLKCTATRTPGGWRLEGTKSLVPDAGTAALVLVLARLHDNLERSHFGVFAVPSEALGAGLRRHGALGGAALYEIDLRGIEVPAQSLLGGESAAAGTASGFQDVVEKVTALQCMEMAGGIASVLRQTVAYVTERHQHGRPIGSFQAVQHMLANVQIGLDSARVAALQALWLKSEGRAAAREVSIAKIALGELYANATVAAHQLWGAMGYARETGLYLWSERAKITDARYGTGASHLRRLAVSMGL